MRTIQGVSQTLAHTAPSTHSSSLSRSSGSPWTVTPTLPSTSNVAGSRKVSVELPSLMTRRVPS